MLRTVLLLVVTCLLTTRFAQADDNWPNFHGPQNDNHTDSTGLPLTWSETENIVWKTAIHDTGWSSPVVWGDQIWMTTATDDGKKSFVVCIDKNTGAIVFDRLLFETEKPEDTRQYNSFASPSPVIEEGRVYVSFGSYGTACLDTRTGETLWSRRDLPCKHWRGPGASPILYENMLIMHLDDYDFQYVVALDKQTGQTIWKKPREIDYGTTNGDYMKAYGTPIVIEVNGRKQLISPSAKAAIAYDPQTAEELWRIIYTGHSIAARPLFAHGLVYLFSGSQKKLFAVKPDGRGNVTDSHVVWSYGKSMPHKPSPLIVGDLIYIVDDGGVVTCLEAKTGEVVFAERLGGDFSASPLYAEGRIYLSSHQGITTVIAPERKLKILAKNELDGSFRASPAVTGKAFILRTETHLYRVEKKN